MSWYANLGIYIWTMFQVWGKALFVQPWLHKDMLWLLIPIWTAWFFAEFFQEKRGTTMGNAITNAVVVVWGSVDCTRQTIQLMQDGIANFWNIASRFILIGIILSYGVLIVILGLKGKKIIKYIGRVREVTYVFAMFTPVFYNVIELTWQYIFGVIVFFPLFYFVIELLDRYTPDSKAVQVDLEKDGRSDSFSSSSSSSDSFGSSSDSFGNSSNSFESSSSSSSSQDSSSSFPSNSPSNSSANLDDFKL